MLFQLYMKQVKKEMKAESSSGEFFSDETEQQEHSKARVSLNPISILRNGLFSFQLLSELIGVHYMIELLLILSLKTSKTWGSPCFILSVIFTIYND